MDDLMLRLRPDAEAVRENGRVGLRLGAATRFAQGAVQTAILEQLLRGPRTTGELTAALRQRDSSAGGAPLALADFILAFGDYLRKPQEAQS